MKFKCTQCKSTYNINDDRIPENGGNVRCKVCKHVFKIYRPDIKKSRPPKKIPQQLPQKKSQDISLPVIIVTEDQIKKNLLKKILEQYNISATFYDNTNNIHQMPQPPAPDQSMEPRQKIPVTIPLQTPKEQRLTDLQPKHSRSMRRRQLSQDSDTSDNFHTPSSLKESQENIASKHVSQQLCPLGLDIGTSHIIVANADNNNVSFKTDLNAFFTVPAAEVTQKTLHAHKIPFFVKDRKIYVCGNPAQDFANIFNADIRRPIEKGLISSIEEDGLTVIRAIIEQIVPASEKPGEPIGFGVPGVPQDVRASVTYHESIIIQYLKELGYKPFPVNEGFATVIAELADNAYTGIGISMGGGMCNVCMAYMAVPILSYSIQKGGDYIDEQVAQSVGESTAKVRVLKQENLDLTQAAEGRILTALSIFYDEIIALLIRSFIDVIDTSSRIPRISKAMPIVISGGTAMPPGLEDRFANALSGINFPVRVSEIRVAQDPLYTTAKGAMIMAMSGGDIVPGGKNGS